MSIFSDINQKEAEDMIKNLLNIDTNTSSEICKICKECDCFFLVWHECNNTSDECYIHYYPLSEKKHGNLVIQGFVRSDNVIRRIENGKNYMFIFDSPILLIISLILTFKENTITELSSAFLNHLINKKEFNINQKDIVIKTALGLLSLLRAKKVRISNFETCILYTLLINNRWRNKSFEIKELCEYYKEFRKEGECCFHINNWECTYNKYRDSCVITGENIEKIVLSLYHKGILKYDENGKYKLKEIIF